MEGTVRNNVANELVLTDMCISRKKGEGGLLGVGQLRYEGEIQYKILVFQAGGRAQCQELFPVKHCCF